MIRGIPAYPALAAPRTQEAAAMAAPMPYQHRATPPPMALHPTVPAVIAPPPTHAAAPLPQRISPPMIEVAAPLPAKRIVKSVAYDTSEDDTTPSNAADDSDDETRRVTVWNPKTGKKLSGNAGVFKKNLAKYLRTHPEWVVWTGQDKSPRRRAADAERSLKRKRPANDRLSIEEDSKRKQFQEPGMPTAQDLWRSLLAVCCEKAILAEVDSLDTEDESPERLEKFSLCAPPPAGGYRSYSPCYSPAFATPAVG